MDDVEQIKQLKARYFRTMDTKDWDGMRRVFTDDVVMDTTESDGGLMEGGDDFVAFLREVLDGVITVHHGHMPEITVTSPTEATGIWAMEDQLRWPDGTELRGYGHYHERYAKVDGEWRIAASKLTRLRRDITTPPDAVVSAGTVVVTGGASGFGLALAGEAASRGYDVAVLDRDGAAGAAEALAADHGVEAIGLAVDVADGAAVDAAAAAVDERFGGCDVVISNVGVQLFGAIDRLTDAEWQWVLNVNVVGSARVARAFLLALRRASVGRLAFTTSSSVLDPASRMAAYQASKFAVWGLAETLRLELAPDGITVTTVFPSGMVTRHLETSTDAQPAAIQRPIGVDDDFTVMLESNPGMAASVAMPEDIAGRTLDAILAGELYVVTHGDLGGAIAARADALQAAASAAR